MRQLNVLHTPHGELNAPSRTSALEPDSPGQTPPHPRPPTCRVKHSRGQNRICLALLVATSVELEQSPHGEGSAKSRTSPGHRSSLWMLRGWVQFPGLWIVWDPQDQRLRRVEEVACQLLPRLGECRSDTQQCWKLSHFHPFGYCNGFCNTHWTSMPCEGPQEGSETPTSGCWIRVCVCNPRLFATKSGTFPWKCWVVQEMSGYLCNCLQDIQTHQALTPKSCDNNAFSSRRVQLHIWYTYCSAKMTC